MGRACSRKRGRGVHIGYWWETQKERDHQEDQDVSGWIILKWIVMETRWGGMDWIWLKMGTSGGLL
jgi:hypothetical protein